MTPQTFTPAERYPQPNEIVWLKTDDETGYEGKAIVSDSSPDHWEIPHNGMFGHLYIAMNDEYELRGTRGALHTVAEPPLDLDSITPF